MLRSFFFFKQKTAYEMRISDWSSDVCSSDLCPAGIDGCFLSTITLTMPESIPAALPTQDLSLTFGFVNRLPRVESDIFDHRLVNGDLQQLTLKPGAVLEPGASSTIRRWGLGAYYSKALPMPNAHLAARGLAGGQFPRAPPGRAAP